jgi:hypothetical protein
MPEKIYSNLVIGRRWSGAVVRSLLAPKSKMETPVSLQTLQTCCLLLQPIDEPPAAGMINGE